MSISTPEEAYAVLLKHGITPPAHMVYKNSLLGMPIQQFIASQCYLEKTQLMPTYPWVNNILDLALYPEKFGFPHWFTILYSTIKKSIKTTISSCIARWVAETFEGKQEIIFLASDAEQAKGRGYQMFRDTIEKHPRYMKEKRILYGPSAEELWSITDRHALYLPDGSEIKPVSSDYAGESGANPTATFYTELWTWRMAKDEKLYSEMTTPPTRPHGFRWIDSYAGYTGQSSVLWNVWKRLERDGVRLTRDMLPPGFWPFDEDEELPLFVNIPARTFGYIDQGVSARRFKWQRGDVGNAYYIQERAAALNDADYLRLNENRWAEPTQSLLPIQWYDNCEDKTMEPLKDKAPVVISVDASVTHDCSAMTLHSRHPTIHTDTVVRQEAVWDPKELGELDYDTTILPQLALWARRYNIVSVVYDKYQLKYLMDRVSQGQAKDIRLADGTSVDLRALPVRSFNQQSARRESDSMFVSMIRDRHFHHAGDCPQLRRHILDAAATHDSHENTKLHIVKRDDDSKIDCCVAASMGNYEVMEVGI